MRQFYVGVKIVKAELAEKDGEPGYNIIYDGGYISWSPKEVFEKYYFPMGEAANKVTQEMVDSFVPEIETSVISEKTVFARGATLTGFDQFETSSCVEPDNFDEAIGKEACEKRIKDRIWAYLGFVIQWGRFGLKQNNND